MKWHWPWLRHAATGPHPTATPSWPIARRWPAALGGCGIGLVIGLASAPWLAPEPHAVAATAPLPTWPAPACPTLASAPASRAVAAPTACPPQRDDTAVFAVMPGRPPDPAYLGFEAADDADFPLSPAPFAASAHPALEQGSRP